MFCSCFFVFFFLLFFILFVVLCVCVCVCESRTTPSVIFKAKWRCFELVLSYAVWIHVQTAKNCNAIWHHTWCEPGIKQESLAALLHSQGGQCSGALFWGGRMKFILTWIWKVFKNSMKYPDTIVLVKKELGGKKLKKKPWVILWAAYSLFLRWGLVWKIDENKSPHWIHRNMIIAGLWDVLAASLISLLFFVVAFFPKISCCGCCCYLAIGCW